MSVEVGEKGICRLGVVPVRREHSDNSEMVTQLLFGEHYSVLHKSEDEKWLYISIHFDSYEGWIDAKQHTFISLEYFEQINISDYKISLDNFASILFKKSPLTIVAGSILPIFTNELFKMEEQLAFNGESKSLSQKRDFEFLKQQGMKYINTPYLWGGKSPLGIDCSGLVQVLFKMAGYFLPRDSGEQVLKGKHIASFEELKPGDLVFFSDSDKINHVGIALEGNEILHASGKVRIDTLDATGIISTETQKHTHHFKEIRRIFKE